MWLKRMWYKNYVFRFAPWLTTLIITAIALALTIAFAMMGMNNVLTTIIRIVTCIGVLIVLSGMAAILVNADDT